MLIMISYCFHNNTEIPKTIQAIETSHDALSPSRAPFHIKPGTPSFLLSMKFLTNEIFNLKYVIVQMNKTITTINDWKLNNAVYTYMIIISLIFVVFSIFFNKF